MATEKPSQTAEEKVIAKFKRLAKAGKSPKQIMQAMGIQERQYYRYKARAETDTRRKQIDKQEYFRLIMNGYATKDDLAEELGVSKPTLIAFETANNTAKKIGRYMVVTGYKDEIAKRLRITAYTAKEIARETPAISDVEKQLKTIRKAFSEMVEFCPDLVDKLDAFDRAISILHEADI